MFWDILLGVFGIIILYPRDGYCLCGLIKYKYNWNSLELDKAMVANLLFCSKLNHQPMERKVTDLTLLYIRERQNILLGKNVAKYQRFGLLTLPETDSIIWTSYTLCEIVEVFISFFFLVYDRQHLTLIKRLKRKFKKKLVSHHGIRSLKWDNLPLVRKQE